MRRLLTWIVVSLGIAAIARRLRRRRAAEDAAVAPLDAGDPADELRQKLAESRSEPGPSAAAPVASEATVEDRRADVHEQARSTVDEMREGDETS